MPEYVAVIIGAISVLVAVAVASDAEDRGMSGLYWGLGSFFLPVLAIPAYFVCRTPKLLRIPPVGPPRLYCNHCGAQLTTGANRCTACGQMVVMS